ncbi:MAG: hypothetical protein M1816_002639 [Peltula sp. TS41687]|nr:MAG: hypothetical protein M1816_002639 [Peltula sp. TS41687]
MPRSEMPSPPATRSQSVASDRTSAFKAPLLPSPQLSRRPEPAYIAASAASQIVTTDQDPFSLDLHDESEIPTNGEPALVAQASLKLVNCFLDQLLYDFLSVARSTSLASLRPAVTEILRPKLADEAIGGADEELHEYLGRGVEEDQLGYHGDPGPVGGWDLDAVWRQARLRCMVYSSLGDMEEEMFLAEEQHPGATDGSGYFSGGQDLVSPAVAIFLTSILEFIGEHILLLAGHAAAQRLLSRRRDAPIHNGSSTSILDEAGRLIVDEQDTEKVALNPTFGRLWRAWRKRVRASVTGYPRSKSRDSNLSRRRQHSVASSSRRSSIDAVESRNGLRERSRTDNLGGVPEEDFAAKIALPMSENDIEEIEVPGVADLNGYTRAMAKSEGVERKRRPQSLTMSHVTSAEDASPDLYRTYPPMSSQLRTSELFHLTRRRSQSLPSLVRSPFGANSEMSNHESAPSHHLQNPKVDIHKEHFHTEDIHKGDVYNEDVYNGNFHKGNVYKEDVHKESSKYIDQAPRGEPSRLHDDIPLVNHEDEQAGTSEFAANADDTAADVRTISSGSSLGLIREDEIEDLPGAVDLGTLDGSFSRAGIPRLRMNESAMYGAPYMVNGRSEHSFDTGSVSPLDPSDMSDERIAADIDVSSQSDDREMDTDHATIGVARTSNVPVFVTKSTYLNNPSPGPHPFESQQAGSALRSTRHENDAHGVDSSVYVSKEMKGSIQQRPKPQARESPVLPQTPSSQPDPGLGSKRTSPLELQQTAIGPGLGVFKDEHSPTSGSPNGHLATSRLASSPRTLLTKQSPVDSRTSEQTLEYAPAASPSLPGRASVQRLVNPPSPAREVAATSTRRSDSYGRGQGSVQRSNSGAPQESKNLVPRPHDEGEVQEQGGHHADEIGGGRRPASTAVKSGNKEKSFEQLMRSDETIQYTLTPPSVREMEENLRRTDTAASTRSPKKFGPTFATRPPSSDTTSSPSFTPSDFKGVKPALSISRPAGAPSKPRPGVPIARDGRAEWTSTRDFAEFIRTTGPDKVSDIMPGTLPSRSDSVPSKLDRSRSVGGPLHPVRSRSRQTSAAAQPSIAESKSDSSRSSKIQKPRVRLQARDAVVSQGDDSSALVDFIRQGPPGLRNEQESSIAQVIAPFNSPPDPTPGFSRARVRDVTSTISTASTYVGSSRSQAQSVHSYNSQTALLESRGVMGEATRSENGPPIQRRRHHVRDPYAIDSDSEEEEDGGIESRPRAKPGREESLMDFLRNVPPPSEQATLPSAFDDLPKPGPKTLSKRSKPTAKKAGPKEEQLPSSSSIVSSQAPQLSLPSHGHDSSFDTTDALRAAARSVVNGPLSAGGNTEHRPPALGASQPRSGRSEQGRSNELAMFLNTTEPPVTATRNPPVAPARNPSAAKEESGFSKIFRKIRA